MKEYSIRFANNIRAICRIRRMSIGNLEKEVGMQVGYLSRISKGYVELSLENAVLISNKVNYPIEQLVYGDIPKQLKLEALRGAISELEAELEDAKNELASYESQKEEEV